MKIVNLILTGIKAILLCYIVITYITIPVISIVYLKLTEKLTVELTSKEDLSESIHFQNDTVGEKATFQSSPIIGYKSINVDKSNDNIDTQITGSHNIAIGYRASRR